MVNHKKQNSIITTHELGKLILKKSKCPTPIYHGKGYKEAKNKKSIKI